MKPPTHVEEARMAGYQHWADEVREAFLEDVEWLLDDGITLDALAVRLEMSRALIEKRLRNYGRIDLWARLNPERVEHGPRDLVDATPVAEHLRRLAELRWTDEDLAQATASSRATIQGLRYGTRATTRRALADRILSITEPPAPHLARPDRRAWKEQGMRRRTAA